MKTITLTDKDFKDGVYCGKHNLTNIDGSLDIQVDGWCRFKSGISTKGDISAEGGISTKGDISAEGGISAEGSIYAEGDISAGGGIYARGYISANGGKLSAKYGITAGLSIYAKTTIEAGKRIFAGVAPWDWVTDEHREIKCGKLLKGEIGYGELIELGLPEEKIEESEDIIILNGIKYKKI